MAFANTLLILRSKIIAQTLSQILAATGLSDTNCENKNGADAPNWVK